MADIRRMTATWTFSGILLISFGCYRQVPIEQHAEPASGAPNDELDNRRRHGAQATPTFDWPEGLTLIAMTTTVARRNNTKIAEETVSRRLRTTHGTTPDGAPSLTVAIDRLSSSNNDEQETPAGMWAEGQLHVDAEGRLLREAPAAPARRRTSRPPGPPDPRGFVDKGWWQHIVGYWAGRQLELSEAMHARVDGTLELPAVGRVQLPVETEVSVEPTIGCAADASSSCLRIELRKRPHVHRLKEQMQSWVETYADRLADERGMPTAPEIRVATVFAEYRVELVTERDTLVPSQLETSRLVRMRLRESSTGDTDIWKFIETESTEFHRGTAIDGVITR